MLFIPKEGKYNILYPPSTKRLMDSKGRDMATRTSVGLYQQLVTWILTRSRLSDLDYKVVPSLNIII